MKTVWFRQEHNKSKDLKKGFEDSIKNSRVLIDRFIEILDAYVDQIEMEEQDTDMYDAGYPYRQSFMNGQKKTIKKIKDLFDFEKGNTP